LAFLIEEEVTARFLRDVNAEVKHGGFYFLLGDDSKQVPSLQRSNPYSLGDKWSLDINRGP